MPARRQTDDAFITALVCGASVEAAARAAGISLRTAQRRLADPAFRDRLRQVRDDIVQRTSGALVAASTESVKTLMELQKPSAPPNVRLGAARAVLEMGIKLRELTDLSERIAFLEGGAGGGKEEK